MWYEATLKMLVCASLVYIFVYSDCFFFTCTLVLSTCGYVCKYNKCHIIGEWTNFTCLVVVFCFFVFFMYPCKVLKCYVVRLYVRTIEGISQFGVRFGVWSCLQGDAMWGCFALRCRISSSWSSGIWLMTYLPGSSGHWLRAIPGKELPMEL